MKITANNTVAYRNYGQFGVIMNCRTAHILKLNEVGTDLWELVSSKSTIYLDEVIGKMLEAYDVSSDRLVPDIMSFIVNLNDAGIIEISEDD